MDFGPLQVREVRPSVAKVFRGFVVPSHAISMLITHSQSTAIQKYDENSFMFAVS